MSPEDVPDRPTVDIEQLPPQPGPQTAFLASAADIAILGGAAGGGKSWALLREPLRHIENPHFGAVFFRRTYPQITNEGGLWDEAGEMYPVVGGLPREGDLQYRWRSGFTVSFAHMQHARDRLSWKGAQIPSINFDQLEDFEERQFWYLFSRNRSARAGVRPYMRATCNPVPPDDEVGGWLATLIAWWIDQDTGYAIPARSGQIRWFVRIDEQVHWADSPEALYAQFGHRPRSEIRPKSLTFIPAMLADNPKLEAADPDYRAKLMAMPRVERERLLHGNWKIRPSAGKVFNRANFRTLAALPHDIVAWVRYWDKAGTEGGGKFSAGALVGRRANGDTVLADVERGQWSSGRREAVIKQKAQADAYLAPTVETWVEREPGSGGKESAEHTIRNLSGHIIRADRVTGDKLTRAGPLAAQVEAQNVYLVAGTWNEAFLAEAHRFDGVHGIMDQIDAAAGGFNKVSASTGAFTGEVVGVGGEEMSRWRSI